MKNTHTKRYAASACAFKGLNKIFLFGGRSNSNNEMVKEIEEYNRTEDYWKILTVTGIECWVPVEINASIQLNTNQVLIFGGSDAQISDSANSYIFNVNTLKIERSKPLQKAQVFLPLPISYGQNVYAIGNEYYVKNRSVHKFNRIKKEWEIMFN